MSREAHPSSAFTVIQRDRIKLLQARLIKRQAHSTACLPSGKVSAWPGRGTLGQAMVKLSAMTSATTTLGAPALGALMIPMAAPGAMPLGATMIATTASGMAALRSTRTLVTSTSLWPPRATETLEPNACLRATTTTLCRLAAFLPHLDHVLRRPRLATACLWPPRATQTLESTTSLRATTASLCGFAAFLPHLNHLLRRACLTTAAAGAGSSTLPRLERALFHLGDAIV